MEKKTMHLILSRIITAIVVAFLSVACAHSQVTLFNQNSAENLTPSKSAPTQPVDIGIYRSMIPFEPFVEIGLITLKSSHFDLPWIYDQLRTDSAKHGAQAVVAVKIKGETHNEWISERKCEPKTDCDMNGICTTHEECHDEQVLKEVTSFMTEGSMIRRKP